MSIKSYKNWLFVQCGVKNEPNKVESWLIYHASFMIIWFLNALPSKKLQSMQYKYCIFVFIFSVVNVYKLSKFCCFNQYKTYKSKLFCRVGTYINYRCFYFSYPSSYWIRFVYFAILCERCYNYNNVDSTIYILR